MAGGGEKYHIPTIAEIAHETGYTEDQVREIVEALEHRGVLFTVEPGDRIAVGSHAGMSSAADPSVRDATGGPRLPGLDYWDREHEDENDRF